MENGGIFHDHLEYFTAIGTFLVVWYSLYPFGIFFPVWYVWTKKNLVPLASYPSVLRYG
jgi:hypothetical protein